MDNIKPSETSELSLKNHETDSNSADISKTSSDFDMLLEDLSASCYEISAEMLAKLRCLPSSSNCLSDLPSEQPYIVKSELRKLKRTSSKVLRLLKHSTKTFRAYLTEEFLGSDDDLDNVLDDLHYNLRDIQQRNLDNLTADKPCELVKLGSLYQLLRQRNCAKLLKYLDYFYAYTRARKLQVQNSSIISLSKKLKKTRQKTLDEYRKPHQSRKSGRLRKPRILNRYSLPYVVLDMFTELTEQFLEDLLSEDDQIQAEVVKNVWCSEPASVTLGPQSCKTQTHHLWNRLESTFGQCYLSMANDSLSGIYSNVSKSAPLIDDNESKAGPSVDNFFSRPPNSVQSSSTMTPPYLAPYSGLFPLDHESIEEIFNICDNVITCSSASLYDHFSFSAVDQSVKEGGQDFTTGHESPDDRSGQLNTPPPPVSNDDFIPSSIPSDKAEEKNEQESFLSNDKLAECQNSEKSSVDVVADSRSIIPSSISLRTEHSVDLDEASSVEVPGDEEDLSELELGDFQVVEEWEHDKSASPEPTPPLLDPNYDVEVVDLTEKSAVEDANPAETENQEDDQSQAGDVAASPCRNIFDIFHRSPGELMSDPPTLEPSGDCVEDTAIQKLNDDETTDKNETPLADDPKSKPVIQEQTFPEDDEPPPLLGHTVLSEETPEINATSDHNNSSSASRKRQLETDILKVSQHKSPLKEFKKRKRESLKKKLEEVNEEIARISSSTTMYKDPSSVPTLNSAQSVASPVSKAASSPARHLVCDSPKPSSNVSEDCVVVNEKPMTSPAALIAGLIFSSQQTCSSALNEIINLYDDWEGNMMRQQRSTTNHIAARSLTITFKRNLDQFIETWKNDDLKSISSPPVEQVTGHDFRQLEATACDKVDSMTAEFIRNVHNSFKLLIPDNQPHHGSVSHRDLLSGKQRSDRSVSPESNFYVNLGNLPQFSLSTKNLYHKLVADPLPKTHRQNYEPKKMSRRKQSTPAASVKSTEKKELRRRSRSGYDRVRNRSDSQRQSDQSKYSHQSDLCPQTSTRSSSSSRRKKEDEEMHRTSQPPSVEKAIDSIESIEDITLSDPYESSSLPLVENNSSDPVIQTGDAAPDNLPAVQKPGEILIASLSQPEPVDQSKATNASAPSTGASKRALSPKSSRIRGMLLSYKRDVANKPAKPLDDAAQQVVQELISKKSVDKTKPAAESDDCAGTENITIDPSRESLPTMTNSSDFLASVPLPSIPASSSSTVQLPQILTSLLASSQKNSKKQQTTCSPILSPSAADINQIVTGKPRCSPTFSSLSVSPLSLPFPPTCDIPLPAQTAPNNLSKKFEIEENVMATSKSVAVSSEINLTRFKSAPSETNIGKEEINCPDKISPKDQKSENSFPVQNANTEISPQRTNSIDSDGKMDTMHPQIDVQIPGILDGYVHESTPSPSEKNGDVPSVPVLADTPVVSGHKIDIDERVHIPTRRSSCNEISTTRASNSPVSMWHRKRFLVINESDDPVAAKVKSFLEAEGSIGFDGKNIALSGKDLNVFVHGDWFSCMNLALKAKSSNQYSEMSPNTELLRPPSNVNLLQLKQYACVHMYAFQSYDDVVENNMEVLFPHGRSCLMPDHDVLIKTHPDTLHMLLEFMEQEKTFGRIWSIKISHQAMNQIKLYIPQCPSSEVTRMDSLIGLLNDSRWCDLLEMLPPSHSTSETLLPNLQDSLELLLRLQKNLQREYRHFCLFTASLPPDSLSFEYSRYGISIMSLEQFVSSRTKKSITKVLPSPEFLPPNRDLNPKYSDSHLSWCQDSINAPSTYPNPIPK